MNSQKYELWTKYFIKEEQPVWMYQLTLCLVDMAFMMAGAWICLAIGNLILKTLVAH